MEKITKRFPGVVALDGVDFDLKEAEIHALVGENGAGKSTLIKILGGVHKPDAGTITLNNRRVYFHSPLDAQLAGISVIHQELNLVEELTVAENMFLGREKRWWFVDRKKMRQEAASIMEKLKFHVNPSEVVKNLNVSEKQLVSIAKALTYKAQIIVMDEPTAAITKTEVDRLFKIMKDLKTHGVSVIFISHRIEEIYEVADRVTILRDGKKIGTYDVGSVSKEDLIRMMVGRKIDDMYPKYNTPSSEVIFKVVNLRIPGKVHDVSFEVKRGEIFGIAGLVGSGKSEIAMGIFGAIRAHFDEMYLYDKRVSKISTPVDAIRHGIVMIPEDRKSQGLVLILDVLKNLSVANPEKVTRASFILDWKRAKEFSLKAVEDFRIKVSSIQQLVKNLSGGNQQKVVLSKFLYKSPKLVLLVEPTRGIDVGAKVEVYHLINRLANSGVGVVFISSELPEVVSLCDTVLVMHRGRAMALLTGSEVTQENILKAAAGVEVA